MDIIIYIYIYIYISMRHLCPLYIPQEKISFSYWTDTAWTAPLHGNFCSVGLDTGLPPLGKLFPSGGMRTVSPRMLSIYIYTCGITTWNSKSWRNQSHTIGFSRRTCCAWASMHWLPLFWYALQWIHRQWPKNEDCRAFWSEVKDLQMYIYIYIFIYV